MAPGVAESVIGGYRPAASASANQRGVSGGVKRRQRKYRRHRAYRNGIGGISGAAAWQAA